MAVEIMCACGIKIDPNNLGFHSEHSHPQDDFELIAPKVEIISEPCESCSA